MAVFADFLNTTISLIERPSKSGVGGQVITETLVESGVRAIRIPFNVFATAGDFLLRETDSELVNAENSFFLDLNDADSVIRTLQPGDLLSWASDVSGGPSSDESKDEVIRVNVWDAPTAVFDRAHVEILSRGSGV